MSCLCSRTRLPLRNQSVKLSFHRIVGSAGAEISPWAASAAEQDGLRETSLVNVRHCGPASSGSTAVNILPKVCRAAVVHQLSPYNRFPIAAKYITAKDFAVRTLSFLVVGAFCHALQQVLLRTQRMNRVNCSRSMSCSSVISASRSVAGQ